MQTAIRLPYPHVGTAYHPRSQTYDGHQPGNGRERKKKAPAARKRNGFLTGRILPVISDTIRPPFYETGIDLSTGEDFDYLYRSAVRYAGLLGSELPYRKPRRCKHYRPEIARLYRALDSILADQVNLESCNGKLSFCVYRHLNWPDDTLLWLPVDFTERLPRQLKRITLEFIRRFVAHHRMQKVTDSMYYEMTEDFALNDTGLGKKEQAELRRLEASYKEGGKAYRALARMYGNPFCTRLEEKLGAYKTGTEDEEELLGLIREGLELIGEGVPCIMDYEYDWAMEESPDFFPITMRDQVALAYSINDRVAKEMECYLNSSLQESYALTPVSTLLLTPDTRTLLQEDNYPERFADSPTGSAALPITSHITFNDIQYERTDKKPKENHGAQGGADCLSGRKQGMARERLLLPGTPSDRREREDACRHSRHL